MSGDPPEWLRDVGPIRAPDPDLPAPGVYELIGSIGPMRWTVRMLIGWDGAAKSRRLTDVRIEDE